jgi:hypothetical protein
VGHNVFPDFATSVGGTNPGLRRPPPVGEPRCLSRVAGQYQEVPAVLCRRACAAHGGTPDEEEDDDDDEGDDNE